MASKNDPVISSVLEEISQSHEAKRKGLIVALEKDLGRAVVTLFTSFNYPVMIDDADVDMVAGVLQHLDLGNGIALVLNSPGGDGLAAERMIEVCRSFSGTAEFWAIIPGKAKSAGTLVAFGASKILMGPTAELGPVDPQLIDQNTDKRFSVYNLVKSYDSLFRRAEKTKGHLEPYLQQLQKYDAREIAEYRMALSLSEDISVRSLKSGMMRHKPIKEIKRSISAFLTPERAKTHGRPIYAQEAMKCGLNVESVDLSSCRWKLLYELYYRSNHYANTEVAKCIESSLHSFIARRPE